MTSWTHRPPKRSRRHHRLAAARDVAIIAVCAVILAFALLAVSAPPHEAAPREPRPAAARLRI